MLRRDSDNGCVTLINYFASHKISGIFKYGSIYREYPIHKPVRLPMSTVRNFLLFSIFCTLLLSFLLTLSLDSQTVRDQSGRLMGRIDEQGTVRDASGRLLGRIDDKGTVRDASGRLMGRIDERSTVRDASGRLKGRITNGTVRDASGRLMGRVDDNGNVRDASGRLIGRTDGVRREHAAAFFFFFW